MTFNEAEQFLKSHYCEDHLDNDQIRKNDEHFNYILGNVERFPNANVDFITKFSDAASIYLTEKNPR